MYLVLYFLINGLDCEYSTVQFITYDVAAPVRYLIIFLTLTSCCTSSVFLLGSEDEGENLQTSFDCFEVFLVCFVLLESSQQPEP